MIKTKKRFLSVGLAVLMLLAAVMFVIPAAGVKAAWDGTAASGFANGSGTEADPYLISNAKELAFLAEKVNLGNDTASTYYKLTDNIDVSGHDWTAIGDMDGKWFKGTFDGNYKVVSGIQINKPDENNQGLFGLSTGTIKNVGIENSSIIGGNNVGGVCGYNSYGTIEGCYNTGDIKATFNNAGGICGWNCGDSVGNKSRILNCYNTGTVEGKTAGGICAVNYDGEISYCYNAGKVAGSSAGAICGMNQYSTITNCYYSKDICSVVRVAISDGSVIQAEGISTKKLSDITNLSGFDPTVWETGAAGAVDNSSNNFSIQEYTLPSLISFNKAQKVKINVYNFGVDGKDDWDEYTAINTAAELQNINRIALSGNYVLMKDIELNNTYNNWKAIGNYTSPFTGKFSGEGHIVSKINISNGSDYQGLFGYSTGVIKDVGVEDSSIIGSSCVGGVCGLNEGIIERCYNTSYIRSGNKNAGGICGSGSGADAKIQKCYNTGNVEGNYSGGICGNNSIGMISDCYSTGKISGKAYKGSICGFNSFDSSNYPNVKNCYYSKDICKVGGINNSDETGHAEGISTEELCNITALSGFDTAIWENGSVTVNGNLRENIFPRLKNVGKQNNAYKDYNFGVDGQENWETYTPIYTAEALQNINNDLSGNYVLMNDIDVAKETNKTENNWTPLGRMRVFYGKFSGDGHVVSGININMPNKDTQGLFGNSSGVIKNVGVENSSITGSAMVGGICGYNRGKIENCYNTGDIKATFSDAGGICGHSNGEIYNCYNTGTISSDGYAGGICGNVGENLIHFCYNAGKVSGSTQIGGICGRIYGTGTVSNCYYSNEICSVGGINGNDISGQAEGITTEELCDILSHNFDSGVWANGSMSMSENGVFKERTVMLPYLKNVGSQQKVITKYYNFGINGADDWDIFTPITTAEELQAINTDDTTRSGNYVLMNDIVIPAGENNFTAIGNDNNTSFTGKFSGNGHMVSGININKTEDYPEPYGYYLGLFGYSEGLIINVNVADSSIIGRRYTGAVCGFNDGGTVWGCSGSGSIKCTDISAGGVCGYNQGGYVSKCYNTGDVSGPSFVGGVCGYNFYSAKITDCYNVGKVTASADGSIAGGVCSYNSSNSTINNCYSTGSLICTGANSEADGICYNIVNDGGTVTNCYYNTDFCEFESSCGTGLTTVEMVSGKMTGFDPSVWTDKPVDKAAKTAYYPALAIFGNDNPIGYETKLDIALSADSETVYGGDYSFDISALVKFDGMTEFRADKTAFTTGCGKYTVVCGDKTLCTGDIYDNTIVTATYYGRDIPRDMQTITLNYDGTGSEFFTSGTASLNADVTHTHTISEGYSYDETSHWKTCTGCDDKIDLEKHSFDEGVITTSSAEDEKTYTCKVCGYKKIENTSRQHKPSDEYSYDETNHWKTCSGCDEKIDLEKHRFDGGVITVPATKETEGEMVYTCTVCVYKKTEIIGKLAESYPIVISGGVTANKSSAEAGETVDVSAPFGYDIIVADANGRQIAKITDKGSFKMPASGVVITAVRGEMFAHMTNAWNHSYVYSYDSDMNRIKVNSDAKRGVITIDLGDDYAGRSFIIYSGRKSTSKKITEGVLDENGRFTFRADEGRNYTLIVK